MARPSCDEIKAEFETLKTTFDESPDVWSFSKVISVDGKSSSEIYSAAKTVLASLFNESKEVIQSDDASAGLLVGKGYCTSPVRTYSGFVIAIYRDWQLVRVECRDGRFKVTVSTSDIKIQEGSVVDKNDFEGQAFLKPSHFYPYNEEFSGTKTRAISWDVLKYVYDSANATIEKFEKGVPKQLETAAW